MIDLDGRLAIVTGSNTGIGRATATELASAGARVILAARSATKTEPVVSAIRAATGNDQVTYLPLDLADLRSVTNAARRLLDAGDPIDILVDNAGVAGQRGLTADGFELAFGVNHLGHFWFTDQLMPLLDAAGSARVVSVSSGNHYRPDHLDLGTVRQPTDTFVGLRAYDRSKLANVLFIQELARRHDPARLAAFSVDPGTVATDVWRRIPEPLNRWMKAAARMKTPEQGSRSSLWAATEPGIEVHSGAYVHWTCTLRNPNPVATAALGGELWARSEEWVAAYR